mmetsp:Transcript_20279/g.49014  ORF Transcript_20279/g.49014 Transcript_20279/m.49014 type:complete len:252 (+) Transcript_20279:738-1493(+)
MLCVLVMRASRAASHLASNTPARHSLRHACAASMVCRADAVCSWRTVCSVNCATPTHSSTTCALRRRLTRVSRRARPLPCPARVRACTPHASTTALASSAHHAARRASPRRVWRALLVVMCDHTSIAPWDSRKSCLATRRLRPWRSLRSRVLSLVHCRTASWRTRVERPAAMTASLRLHARSCSHTSSQRATAFLPVMVRERDMFRSPSTRTCAWKCWTLRHAWRQEDWRREETTLSRICPLRNTIRSSST